MDSFFDDKNYNVVIKRLKITYDKISINKNIREEFLLYHDNLESYVRTMYLLGEPCWGKFSSINNHIHFR